MAPETESSSELANRSVGFKGFPFTRMLCFACGRPIFDTGDQSALDSAVLGLLAAPVMIGDTANSSAQNAVGWAASNVAQRSIGYRPGGYVAGLVEAAFTRNIKDSLFANSSRSAAQTNGAPIGAGPPDGARSDPSTMVAEVTVETTPIDAALFLTSSLRCHRGINK